MAYAAKRFGIVGDKWSIQNFPERIFGKEPWNIIDPFLSIRAILLSSCLLNPHSQVISICVGSITTRIPRKYGWREILYIDLKKLYHIKMNSNYLFFWTSNTILRFLYWVFLLQASKPKAPLKSEKENNPVRTPEALPEDKKMEYRLLKEEIARYINILYDTICL